MSKFRGNRSIIWREIRPFFQHGAKKHLVGLGVGKVGLLVTGFLIPYLFKLLVDQVMLQRKIELLHWVCLGFFGLFLVESGILLQQKRVANRLFTRLTFDIRIRLWQIYMRMPVSVRDRFNAGDLKNRIDTDVEGFERFVDQQVIEYIFNWAVACVNGVVLLWISWKLAVFGFVMVPLSFWMTKWLGGGLRKRTEAYRKVWGQYEGWLQETIQGWKEVKALGIEKSQERIFTRYWHDLSNQFFVRQMYWWGNRTFIAMKDFFITRMNLYFLGGLLIFHGELTIGGLLVFMKYYEKFFGGIGKINDLDLQLATDRPGLDRVLEVLHEPMQPGGVRPTEGGVEEIMLCDLSFQYPQGAEEALQGVNLQIRGGECVALVGRSGCGKSTLVKLILGMYADYRGECRFNGYEVRELDTQWLHRRVGVVMQDSVLFNLSIAENLRLAKPSATDEELREACQKAYIHEFIAKLPEGYGTLIGEKGIKLSGGQRQRMAIARLLLMDVDVVIFDEATSSLDHESEKAIHQAIRMLMKEKTVIIVAHRLSSILLAERVVVLDAGRVVGMGRHSELLGHNAVYDALFGKQYEGVKKYSLLEEGNLLGYSG